MYDVKISVYGPSGEDLSYRTVCDKQTLDELLRRYSQNEISYEALKNGDLSLSGETCFCPYCMKINETKKKKEVYICSSCGKKFVILKH